MISGYVIIFLLFFSAGQHTSYGTIRIGPRPFMESTFSHLRDVDVFKKQGVRSTHGSDGSLNSYKQESQGKSS